MPFKEIKNISVKNGYPGIAPNLNFKKPNYDKQSIREFIGFLNIHAQEDDVLFRENIISWVNDGRRWQKRR